jgi:hypothetical protein
MRRRPLLALITYATQEDEKLVINIHTEPYPDTCRKAFRLATRVAKHLSNLFGDLANYMAEAKQVFFVTREHESRLVLNDTCYFLAENSTYLEPGIIFKTDFMTDEWRDDYGNTLYVEKWWTISSYPITTGTVAEINISEIDLRDMEELRKVLPENKVQKMIKSRKLYIAVPPHATIVDEWIMQRILSEKSVLVMRQVR